MNNKLSIVNNYDFNYIEHVKYVNKYIPKWCRKKNKKRQDKRTKNNYSTYIKPYVPIDLERKRIDSYSKFNDFKTSN